MHQTAIVEHHPERIEFETAQVKNDRRYDILDPLVAQRQREMVVIGDVAPVLGAEDDRDHMAGQELARLFTMLLTPTPALFLDLAHADRVLRRAQFADQRRL